MDPFDVAMYVVISGSGALELAKSCTAIAELHCIACRLAIEKAQCTCL